VALITKRNGQREQLFSLIKEHVIDFRQYLFIRKKDIDESLIVVVFARCKDMLKIERLMKR